MKKTLVLLALSVLGSLSYARGVKTGLEITPIIGYERQQKLIPTPHSKDRLVYGARLRVGVPLVSAEAEYTRAQDTEDYPTTSTSYKDTTQRGKVGLVSQLRLTGLLTFSARAGVNATLTQIETTQSGVTTNSQDPIRYNPYAGAGVRVRLSSKITADADIVAIFRAFPDMNANEYQTTAGFTLSFP